MRERWQELNQHSHGRDVLGCEGQLKELGMDREVIQLHGLPSKRGALGSIFY